MRSVAHLGITVGTNGKVFRGWWVLAGIFAAMSVGSGFAFYAQGVFLDALVEEQGFSVGMAGAGTGTFFVVSGVFGYYSGGLIAKFDVRVVMTIGTLVAAVGMFLMGQVRTEWQMFVVFVIFGGGYALAGLVPTTSLVTRWFARRRSLALAIASTGLSMGGIAITPIIAGLIDTDSLAVVAPRLAVVFAVAMLSVTWLLLRPWPHKYGLNPDGDAEAAPTDNGELPGTPFSEAIRSRYFVIVSAAYVVIMGAQVGAIQHIFKLTKDRLDLDSAKLALIVVTATSVVGRILGGLAAMRVSLLRLTAALVLVQAAGIAVIAVSDTMGTILIGAVVLGSAMGNLLMLHPLLLAEAFGIKDYSRIYGFGSLLMIIGVGSGPLLVGVLKDLLDYQAAFLSMSGLALVGFLILLTASAAKAPGRDTVEVALEGSTTS